MDRPRVIIHNLVSLEGRLDGFPADAGLYYELASRLPHQAVLTGSGTMLAAAASEGIDLLVIVDGQGNRRRAGDYAGGRGGRGLAVRAAPHRARRCSPATVGFSAAESHRRCIGLPGLGGHEPGHLGARA